MVVHPGLYTSENAQRLPGLCFPERFGSEGKVESATEMGRHRSRLGFICLPTLLRDVQGREETRLLG